VRGNTDSPLLGLPLTLRRRFAGLQIEMRHDLTVSRRDLEAWRKESKLSELQRGRREGVLRGFDGATRVVVSGPQS